MAATISIDPNLLYTKSEYSRSFGINRTTLDQKIRDKEIKTLPIKGGVIVVAERR